MKSTLENIIYGVTLRISKLLFHVEQLSLKLVKFRVKFQGMNLIQTLNAELNPVCHLLPLLGAQHILQVSRIRGY